MMRGAFLFVLLFTLHCVACISSGSNVKVPTTGPCVLMNPDNYKCTDKGYFETVQCDNRGCFCVAAHNGQLAYDTRTDNPRTAPQCHECYNTLKNIFANGDPENGTHIPKCDVALGDFEPLQCNPATDVCFCVDPKTGKEVEGTRKRRVEDEYMHCNGSNFKVEPGMVPANNEQISFPVAREECRSDRDAGNRCRDGVTKVAYYFDVSTFACLAFEYAGCGGNNNRFRTKAECESSCLLMDMSGCSGMRPPAKDSKGQPIICGNQPMPPPGVPQPTRRGPTLGPDGCPKEYKCVMGAFFGFCCSKANEERFNRAYKPSCPRGQTLLINQRDGWDEVVLGKACSDRFCPGSHTCHDGDLFAYCCR